MPSPSDSKLLSCHTGEGVKVLRLSDLHGDEWRSRRNRFGDRAMVDYALCEPFQLFSEETATALQEAGERYFNSEFEYSTARTSACIRCAPDLVNLVEGMSDQLEAMASRLVGGGLRMRILESKAEKAHLNVQRHVQSNPVDNWHQDSTPYVLVTILTNHTDDAGGHLMVRHGGEHDSDYQWKLRVPGQAVLMQGSQIWHMAQQSEIGKRLTLVTSFYVDDPLVFDPTSLRVAFEYSPPTTVTIEYLQHALRRLINNSGASTQLSRVAPASALEVNRIMTYEITKLVQEYENGFDLIPESRQKSPGLREAWAIFGETARTLKAALNVASSMEGLHKEIGSAAVQCGRLLSANIECRYLCRCVSNPPDSCKCFKTM